MMPYRVALTRSMFYADDGLEVFIPAGSLGNVRNVHLTRKEIEVHFDAAIIAGDRDGCRSAPWVCDTVDPDHLRAVE